jgi:hypothetical protein
MTLVYVGKAEAEIQVAGTPEERRWHLFDVYIEAMFQRRGKQIRASILLIETPCGGLSPASSFVNHAYCDSNLR